MNYLFVSLLALVTPQQSAPEFFVPTNKNCGLQSAILFVAHHRGDHTAQIDRISRDLHVSSLGSSAQAVASVAREHGVPCEVFKCDVDELDQLKLPIIVFKKMEHAVGHFYLIVGWDDESFTITDALSLRNESVPRENLDKYWSGYVIAVKKEKSRFGGAALGLPLVLILAALATLFGGRSLAMQFYGGRQ